MTTIRIHEQIAFLRKQNNLTQEDLAVALGVTNQSVSKWESAQCCPDIQLLPKLAKLFHVSVDCLLGYNPISTEDNVMLDIRNRVASLDEHDSAEFACKTASVLHAALNAKYMESIEHLIPDWSTEAAIERAQNSQWGSSGIIAPKITTIMRKGTVLFSDNNAEGLQGNSFRQTANIMKDFADAEVLKTSVALYQLTYHDEKSFSSMENIRDVSELPSEKIAEHLDGALTSYVVESEDGHGFRFNSKYMHLIPLFTLLDY